MNFTISALKMNRQKWLRKKKWIHQEKLCSIEINQMFLNVQSVITGAINNRTLQNTSAQISKTTVSTKSSNWENRVQSLLLRRTMFGTKLKIILYKNELKWNKIIVIYENFLLILYNTGIWGSLADTVLFRIFYHHITAWVQ